jgi:hypothetical protein
MKITTMPVCRVGWQGQTLRYVVKAEGATELVAPKHTEGLQVRIEDTRRVGDGVEARLAVRVLNSTLY